MDMLAYLRVVWRFRLLFAIGLILASALALFSVARVGSGGVEFREQETWVSAATILVTQDGFPYGRAVLDEMVEIDTGGPEPALVPRFGDAGRYSGLAALYAELAKGDAVARRVMVNSAPGERYESIVLKDPQSGAALPLIYLSGYATSPDGAVEVAKRATKAFQAYLSSEQAKEDIPPEKRVDLVVTQRASIPQIDAGRSYVRPMFLFILVMLVFTAVAFGLDNLRRNREQWQPPQQWRDDGLDPFDGYQGNGHAEPAAPTPARSSE
jgi:hypothetical protein